MTPTIQAISQSPFAVIPPFTRDGQLSEWYSFKSNGSIRTSSTSVTLNVENVGNIQYLEHNDFLSDANYSKISRNELEPNVILVNTELLNKSLLDDQATMVLAMTGHVLTSSGMCEIMTSMKIDGVMEKGFN